MPSPLEDRARALAMAQNFGADALDLNRRLVAANPVDDSTSEPPAIAKLDPAAKTIDLDLAD